MPHTLAAENENACPAEATTMTSLSDSALPSSLAIIDTAAAGSILSSSAGSPAAALTDVENQRTHQTYLSLMSPQIPSILTVSESESDADDLVKESRHSSSSSLMSSSLLAAEAAALGIDIDESLYGRLDRFGFIVMTAGEEHAAHHRRHASEEGEAEERRKEKEASRAMKWVEMLFILEQQPAVDHWPMAHRKFAGRLVKGIPDCVRTKVWSIFLLRPQLSDMPTFASLYTRISGFERQIDLDIERTLRDHVLFKTRFGQAQVSLFKILVAYSNVDPAVGYCQGMSTVAAFLLLYFDEETSFQCLYRLLHRDNLRQLYMAGFPMLFESFSVQERLMQKYIPDVYRHLATFHIGTSIYATKWYLTLFLGFPFSLATRIWDLFLFHGFDILIVVAVALLKYFESKLLHLDYEPCMQFLSRLPDTPINENRLVGLTMGFWRRYWESEKPGRRHFQALRDLYRAEHPERVAFSDARSGGSSSGTGERGAQ